MVGRRLGCRNRRYPADEGLRLIHGLTNAATAYWCGRERQERFLRYSRTPLPVVLQTLSGPKELWGNEEVFCWFRHTSVGPKAVISSLMAARVLCCDATDNLDCNHADDCSYVGVGNKTKKPAEQSCKESENLGRFIVPFVTSTRRTEFAGKRDI
jgi:hypothetical protein